MVIIIISSNGEKYKAFDEVNKISRHYMRCCRLTNGG